MHQAADNSQLSVDISRLVGSSPFCTDGLKPIHDLRTNCLQHFYAYTLSLNSPRLLWLWLKKDSHLIIHSHHLSLACVQPSNYNLHVQFALTDVCRRGRSSDFLAFWTESEQRYARVTRE